jgi:hypothetical protein
MNTVTQATTQSRRRLRRPGPALTLIFLAPLISEVLNGSTRLSYVIAFFPEMLVWGCGALLAREMVRRWRAGWPSLLLLGLGLSIAEEFIIQQTSVAPLPWAGAFADYGRVWGVNWMYFLFMLAYECVLVVLVPVQLTELAFPEHREKPWLTKWRIVRSAWLFMVGSFMAYYGWVKRARPMMLHVPFYAPPAATLAAGVAAILLLIALAHAIRRTGGGRNNAKRTPSLWVLGIVVLVLGYPWYLVIGAVFSPSLQPPFSFWWEIAAGVALAGVTYLFFRRWTSAVGWGDTHRWTACFAVTLLCIVMGFVGNSTWLLKDVVFKAMVDLLFVVWMVLLLRRLQDAH